ncbi:hypothetical protein HNQ91_000509 [Filimonas zeae]|uniref:Uncharacterized protein n=1 Tax=Filimonas zeae TaxID=1737353 RepID=A0A917IPP2_9BACT|nr:hypothetical protein [Filimonas zeae]MDR6337487.1 hypothetical protein [Filimonas zeae]GGH58856.1 hypothetical protein GCM10011379_04990 [Filimonas zeae]
MCKGYVFGGLDWVNRNLNPLTDIYHLVLGKDIVYGTPVSRIGAASKLTVAVVGGKVIGAAMSGVGKVAVGAAVGDASGVVAGEAVGEVAGAEVAAVETRFIADEAGGILDRKMFEGLKEVQVIVKGGEVELSYL